MVNEWRKDKRSEIDIPLEFEGRVTSLSKNISQSGMLCRTHRQIDEMTLLDIRFQLPENSSRLKKKDWIECSGVVVRCERKSQENVELPFEVAIFFDRISEKNRNLLADYCSGGDIVP